MGVEYEVKKNVVSFINMKGGVGKTTLCVNMAYCLATHFDKNVLLIDMDPQFNATQYLVKDEVYMNEILKNNLTVYSIMKNKVEMGDILIGVEEEPETEPETPDLRYNVANNLDIIAGDLKMLNLEGPTGGLDDRPYRLLNYIEDLNFRNEYDFIFIDCPPTHSIYTTTALNATNYYIMPVKPDFLSTLGLDLFEKMVKQFNKNAPNKVNALGIIFTLVQHYNHPEIHMNRVREKFKFNTFTNILKQSIRIPENAESRTMIYDIPNERELKKSIIDLSEEFLSKF